MTSKTKRPQVALNAVAARTGGGLAYLLGQLPHLENDVDLTVYANPAVARELREALKKTTVMNLPSWAQPLPLRLAWEHLAFPRLARSADVLYSVGSFTSFTSRKRQVVVVLIPYVFGPEGKDVLSFTGAPVPFRVKSSLRRVMGKVTLHQASVLVSASRFTAAQIRATAKVDVDVRIVPLAGAANQTDETTTDLDNMPVRPFALTVGSDQPHKDRLGLVEAWPADGPLDLLAVGRCDHRATCRRLDAAVACQNNVHWFRSLNDAGQLSALYRRAELVIAHSFLEGFGMTPLEAMAADTPVLATDIPPHREVCGDAAIYYDPHDPSALATLVRRVSEDEDIRNQLVEAGRERLKRYRWSTNATEMAKILCETEF